MAFRVNKFELVEISVPGVASTGQTGTRWNFPDLPKLRYTSLQALQVFSIATLTIAPSGQALSSTAILQKSYLVLYSNDRQDNYNVPLLSLNCIQDASNTPFQRGLYEFSGQKATWDKSYISIASAPANTVNFSFVFGIYYN
jgi:hypothetical protein